MKKKCTCTSVWYLCNDLCVCMYIYTSYERVYIWKEGGRKICKYIIKIFLCFVCVLFLLIYFFIFYTSISIPPIQSNKSSTSFSISSDFSSSSLLLLLVYFSFDASFLLLFFNKHCFRSSIHC